MRDGKAMSWSFGRSSVDIFKVSEIRKVVGLCVDANGDQGVLRNEMWRVGHSIFLGTPHNFVCRFFARLEGLAFPVA